ncbi:UbiH/UbiF/VisC/COQ6 family ubiquinone biosynthesis hydroxylase [Pararhodobacter sp. SW119]|uniref:UbiH/UbiF/VisC/COQ6 family ubiquinone biosynthesis hydroxylase n=1 Tax=Pararhodobacter sp. SW119 TaxID=2780075 RepID=UPI001ADF92B4|nr:UbiH/UbiF/VisC/COQ6 family ubiquinone biosynthesis hydroxylase [Pararhodobacter sp. SW119]
MRNATDILIVGGGLNGPALALALAQGGFRVTVIDARPAPARAEPGFDGRAYALALASVRVLSAIGVWAALQDKAQPILGIRVSQGHAGRGASPFSLGFDHAEIEEGPMGQMIEDRHLYAAFRAAMAQQDRITLIDGARVVGQDIAGQSATVTLESGEELSAPLLVASDGRDSPTAARAGIRRQGRDYGQTALVCAVAHARPHDGIAHQMFLPAGPLAILPLPDNRSSIVWVEARETAQAIQRLDDAAYMDLLRPRFGDFLGRIELAGARFAYPLRLSLAEDFVAPRLALVGDAAHGVHPIAGQGLNLGLRDVAALAEVLTLARRRGEDVAAPGVLARYQEWRRFDTVRMALGMDAVNLLFSNGNPVLEGLRGLGLGAVAALPALRRTFIREAAGLRAAQPRLMQGLPV